MRRADATSVLCLSVFINNCLSLNSTQLFPTDSPDSDYDPGELVAQHLAMSGELSQEQILELIDAQKSSGSGSGSKRLEDDSDSDQDILEPSTQARSSNRRGGGGLRLVAGSTTLTLVH